MRTWMMIVALLSVGLAGCVGGNGDDGDDTTPRPGVEYYTSQDFLAELEHDHTDPTLHAASHNMAFVDHHDCTEDGVVDEDTPQITDIKEWGDYLFVNQLNGFCILDISDPYDVTFVSHFEAEAGFDIDVNANGEYVFHGTQRNPPPGTGGPPDPNAEDDLPRGLYVVDVSDKADPTLASFYPVPSNGVHTVHYHKHANGDDLVLIQTYDWFPPSETGLPLPGVGNGPTQRVEILRLVEDETGAQLELVGIYSLPKPPEEPAGDYFPHDCTAQQHPFTERTYMYCAYWNHGLVIVDITNPVQPTLVSQYDDAAPSNYNQYHYVLPAPEPIDDRHITVGAPELQVGVEETGHIRVFDTTDPANPVQLSTWTLPGVPGFDGGFLYSPHQFDIANGHIYMGHNHGGTWVIDISNESLLMAPKSAGAVIPHGDEDREPSEWPRLGNVWVAIEHEGYVYSADRTAGIHVHRYLHDPIPAVLVE